MSNPLFATNEPISVGDMVIVLRENECPIHRHDGQYLGLIFRVQEIKTVKSATCGKCGYRYGHGGTLAYSTEFGFLTNRLKRIPPLDELEGEKQKEDIREPA